MQWMHLDVVHNMQEKVLQKKQESIHLMVCHSIYSTLNKYHVRIIQPKKMLKHKAPKNARESWTPSRTLSRHHMNCRHLLGLMVSVTCNACIYRYSTACISKNHRKLGINTVNDSWLHMTRKHFWQTWCLHNTAKKVSNHKTPETACKFRMPSKPLSRCHMNYRHPQRLVVSVMCNTCMLV